MLSNRRGRMPCEVAVSIGELGVSAGGRHTFGNGLRITQSNIGGKWYRKDDPRLAPATGRKTKRIQLKDEKPVSEFQKMKAAVQAVPEVDEEGVPF